MTAKIKKVKSGWVYDGVLFIDEQDALDALKADQDGTSYEVARDSKISFEYSTDMKATFGRFVMEFIKNHNEIGSILQFASAVKSSRPAFYSWMRGEAMPSKKHIDNLIKVTGLDRKQMAEVLLTNINHHAAKTIGIDDDDMEDLIKGSGKVSGGYAASGHGSKLR